MKAREMFQVPFCISLSLIAVESLNLHFYCGQLTLFHVFDVMITRRPFRSPYVSGFSHFTHSPPSQYNTSNPSTRQSLFYSQSLSICLQCFSEGFS